MRNGTETQNQMGDIPVDDTIDSMHHDIIESIQKAQYEILNNNASRTDDRLRAIIALHSMEKNLWIRIGKLRQTLET